MQLILPSRDGKPVSIEEGTLQTCLAAADEALHRETQLMKRILLVLTDAPKVTGLVTLLRTTWPQQHRHEQRLIGSINSEELMWLLPALDVIVASPEQAVDALVLTSTTLKALLIDQNVVNESKVRSLALDFASHFQGFEEYVSPQQIRDIRHFRWFSPRETVPAPPPIIELVPESSESWDERFLAGLSSFAWGVHKVAVQEWSDVPLFLPGIIRGSLTCDRNSPPLLLAPKDKVELMIKLLHACAAQLGLGPSALTIGSEEGSHILVDCPEALSMPIGHLERLVVVDADKLLNSDCAWKIQRLVKICLNCPVGLHFSLRTEAVNQIVDVPRHDFHLVKELQVSMTRVCQFFSLVQCEEEKVNRVCQVWAELKHPRFPLAVFCNSAEQVVKLAREMKRRGCDAWELCGEDGDEADPKMYQGRFPVLVTDVYRRTSCHVINYELPASYDEYVQRVGSERWDLRRGKVVINIGTASELAHLPLDSMLELPRKGLHIYRRLPELFPHLYAA